ncbi:uncharacterized protein LOC143250250 [Tachypleus tridentatus]|uniref:uncharacterized protein LOC143250250 n=1 Tax=Tachypleus tridentatus TaxID=6853 RepID=UPI003FD163D3
MSVFLSEHVQGKKWKVIESEGIRKDMLNQIQGVNIVVHFDTKILRELKKEIKNLVDVKRTAVSATTPFTESIDFLLGIIQVPSSKGHEQAVSLYNLFEYYDITDQVMALCCDTISSNRGQYNKAIAI